MAKKVSNQTSSGGGGGGGYSSPKRPKSKKNGMWVGIAVFIVLAFLMFAFFA